jgi:uncharacterized protein YdaU (DUF1376 family)
MAALPYMPLYVADYLADAAHLTTQEHGAYLLLIMNYWQRGEPLPNDDTRLARIARLGPREWSRIRDTLSEFFEVGCSTWSHSRIDSELARVSDKSLKSKRAAQASVQRRFGKRSTDVEPTDTDTDTERASNEAQDARALWLVPPVAVSKQTWADFKANRRRKKLGFTPSTYDHLRKELARVSSLTGIPPPSLLEHAAAQGWGGIYDPNERSQRNERASNPTGDALARVQAAIRGGSAFR